MLSGYVESIADPNVEAPLAGAFGGGVEMGGGSAFGGMSGAPISVTGTGIETAPRRVTQVALPPQLAAPAAAAPAQTFTLSSGGATGLRHPTAPAAPKAAPTAAVPAQPTAAPLQSLGAPTSGAVPGAPAAASNPYAASLGSYQAPSNPLLYAQLSAEGQGAPIAPSEGIAPGLSAGGGAPIQVAGAQGPFGGMGNMPPVNAQPGPIAGPTPFAGLIASNANGTQQGNGSQNRGNLQAQSPTRGQALQVPPPPKTAQSLVPPPPATAPTPQQLAMGLANAAAAGADPNQLKLDASVSGLLSFMQNDVNRKVLDGANFKEWIKKNQAILDKANRKFLASQVIGAQKEVEMFEQPNDSGLSMLDLANESLKGVLQARADKHRILHDYATYMNMGRNFVQPARDAANAQAVPNQPANVQTYLQTQQIANIDMGQQKLELEFRKAAYDQAHQREVQELAQSQSIFNEYHKALVGRAEAYAKAYDAIDKRNDAFWKQVDEARKEDTRLDGAVETDVKLFSDIQKNDSYLKHQEIMEKAATEANDWNKTKSQTDLQQRIIDNTRKSRDTAQAQIDKLNDPKKRPQGEAAKQQYERSTKQIQARIDAYNQVLKNLGVE